jgi:hypothetical protein
MRLGQQIPNQLIDHEAKTGKGHICLDEGNVPDQIPSCDFSEVAYIFICGRFTHKKRYAILFIQANCLFLLLLPLSKIA